MARIRKEVIGIYLLVGLFTFSALGTGLLILADSGSSKDTQSKPTTLEDLQMPEPLPTPQAYIPPGDVTALEITDLTVGEGAEVQAGDNITVHYHGTFAADGMVLDSSYQRGEPVSFELSGLIEGWQQGIPGMKIGGKRRLVIPAELAYGAEGGGTVPPNSDLVFEIELISIE